MVLQGWYWWEAGIWLGVDRSLTMGVDWAVGLGCGIGLLFLGLVCLVISKDNKVRMV